VAKRVIAVDIDSTSIRVLEAQGNRVSRWASAPIGPDVTSDGAGPDPAALGRQVRELMTATGIKGGPAIASLSGLYSVCRLMTFPIPAGRSVAGSLPRLVRDAVPVEEMKLQYQLMDTSAAGQRVLVLGCPEASIESQLDVLRSAGLGHRVFETKGLALARLVDRSEALIVNLEETTLDVVLVSGGIPQIVRTMAFPTEPGTEVKGRFVADVLQKTVDFFEGQSPANALGEDTPLFILGAGTVDPSLGETVQAQLAYPVEEITPALECPPGLPVEQYAVNLGLAQRDVSVNSRRDGEEGAVPLHINLAPTRVPPWRISTKLAASLALLAIAVAIITLLFGQVSSVREETESLRGELVPIEQQVSARRAELDQITQMEAGIKQFEGLTSTWGRFTAAAELIQEILTPGITVSSYDISPPNVKFSASAQTVSDALDFVEALRADGRFQVPFSAPTTELSVTFNLSALPTK